MGEISGLILLIVCIAAFVVTNKLTMKFFKRIYKETNVNPLNGKRQIVSAFIFTPILINSFTEILPGSVLIIIGLVAIGILEEYYS